MGGISIWQLAIVLVIVLLLFGTKRLRNLGSDLGSALKGFKKAVNENESDADFPNKQVSQKETSEEETVDTQSKQKSE